MLSFRRRRCCCRGRGRWRRQLSLIQLISNTTKSTKGKEKAATMKNGSHVDASDVPVDEGGEWVVAMTMEKKNDVDTLRVCASHRKLNGAKSSFELISN